MPINFMKGITSILIWSMAFVFVVLSLAPFLSLSTHFNSIDGGGGNKRLERKSWMEFFRMTSYSLLHFAYVFLYLTLYAVLLLVLWLKEYVKCLRLQRFILSLLIHSYAVCFVCVCVCTLIRCTIFFFHIYLLPCTKTSNSLYFTPLCIHDAYILCYPNAHTKTHSLTNWTIRFYLCKSRH